jgi:hypothetical protein
MVAMTITLQDLQVLTKKEIEDARPDHAYGHGTMDSWIPTPERQNALCDLALKGLQAEAMREAIVLNVGRMRNDMKLRGYLSVGTLTSALDDLSQSLNPKNEEGKTAAAPDELRKAYFEGYEDALKDRAAPAEVAEGAPVCPYIVTDKEGTSYCRLAEQVAAPSLSREEWGMILTMTDHFLKTVSTHEWEALRAKVREAAK